MAPGLVAGETALKLCSTFLAFGGLRVLELCVLAWWGILLGFCAHTQVEVDLLKKSHLLMRVFGIVASRAE